MNAALPRKSSVPHSSIMPTPLGQHDAFMQPWPSSIRKVDIGLSSIRKVDIGPSSIRKVDIEPSSIRKVDIEPSSTILHV